MNKETNSVPINRPATVLAMSSATATMILDASVLGRLAEIADIEPNRIVADFHDPVHYTALAEAEILFTGWGCPVLDASALERMPRLRAIVHAAGTVRNHVTDACWNRGLVVTSVAEANAVPVAEYTLAAILMAGKRALTIARLDQEDPFDRERWQGHFPTWGNYGLTVGVVGASRIGRRVIGLLQPFDFTVLVYDPYLAEAPHGARLVGLDELCEASDIVSIHAPELPETRGMFDAGRLAMLRAGTTVVNTARGALVDTDALVCELVAGRLHAILDVTDPEPLPAGHALRNLPNVLLTPHIAGSFGNELVRMAHAAVDEVERYTQGLRFRGAIRPEEAVTSA